LVDRAGFGKVATEVPPTPKMIPVTPKMLPWTVACRDPVLDAKYDYYMSDRKFQIVEWDKWRGEGESMGEKMSERWEKVGGSRGEATRKGAVSERALPHPPHFTLRAVPVGRPGYSKTTHSPLALGEMGGGALITRLNVSSVSV